MVDTQPTLAGFTAWVRNVMGISAAVCPDNSDALTTAYAFALEIVNTTIAQASPMLYTGAVYNLGGDNLLNYAPDLPNAPVIEGSDPPMAFFAYSRKQYNIAGFVGGVIQSAGDESTSQSMVVPEQFKQLTISDLQNLKTPYGRQYLAIAQRYGTIWGVT